MIPAIAAKGSTIADIFRQRCPRCRLGRIFARSVFLGFPKLHRRCPLRPPRFVRAPRLFLGAMYISYGLALVIVTSLAAALRAAPGWSITTVATCAVLSF